MLLEGVPRKDTIVLVDTNVVMEAVRTRCWSAVAGGLRVGPRPALLDHFGERWLSTCRTEFLLGAR